MLSLREQLFYGLVNNKSTSFQIPRKSEFKGTITTDGYCDYDVPEDSWYLEKSNKRGMRLHLSTKARQHRKELRDRRFGYQQ